MTAGALVAALAVAAAFLAARPPTRTLSGPSRPPARGSGAPRGVDGIGRTDSLARVNRTGRAADGGPLRSGPRRYLRRRRRSPTTASVPMVLDLVAEVVASGAAPQRALTAVAECLERAGDPAAGELLFLAARLASGEAGEWSGAHRRADGAGPQGLGALAAAVDLAVSTGAGPVGLIRAAAQEERRRTYAARIADARRAGVLVLLPTGLCLLPAFVLLTVAPLVIDLVLR